MKQTKKSLLLVFVALCFVVLMLFVGMTGAWFTSSDGEHSTTNLRFGDVLVAVSPSMSFTAQELVPGNANPQRHLTISNQSTVSIYVRFYIDILFDGEPAEVTNAQDEVVKLITYSANNTWTLQSDDKYFYNQGSIAPNANVTLDLTFVINDAFGADINASQISINFVLQSVQAANNGNSYSTITWS